MDTKQKQSASWKSRLENFLEKFLPKKYGIVEVFVYGEPHYLAIYKLKGKKWEAIDKDIPDIVTGLISAQDTARYKKRIYEHTLRHWTLYDSKNSTKISEYAEKYCMLKSRQDVEDLIERHREFLKFKKKVDMKPKVIEYMR